MEFFSIVESAPTDPVGGELSLQAVRKRRKKSSVFDNFLSIIRVEFIPGTHILKRLIARQLLQGEINLNAEFIVKSNAQTILKIYVQPGASKNEIVGLYGRPARLKIKIKAPPVDGEANDEVTRFISKLLGISKGRVQLQKGLTSRQKDLLIDLSIEEVGACFSIN